MIKKLDTFIYFSMLFPFVQPFINLGSDVSLYFILGISIRLMLTYNNLKINRLNIFLVIYSIFLLLILFFNGLKFTKAITPFLVSLMIIYYNNSRVNKNIIIKAVYIYLLCTVFWIFETDLATKIQSYFVRNINGDGIIGARGYPILSTEPGLFGGLIIIIAAIFRKAIKSHKYKGILLALLIICSVLSFSGTSIIFLILFILNTNFKKIKNYYYAIFLPTIFLTIPLLLTFENRFTKFFKMIYYLDFNNLLLDTSFIHRIGGFFVGFIFLIKNPFPIGSHGIYETGQIYFTEYLSKYFLNNNEVHYVSSVGLLFAYGGMFSLIWLLLALISLPKSKDISYFLVTISFSYSLIFPLGYLLLYTKTNFTSSNDNIK